MSPAPQAQASPHSRSEDFELDEINISAVCEVMNQMMGASATALSEFLGRMVNISTPISFEVENEIENLAYRVYLQFTKAI